MEENVRLTASAACAALHRRPEASAMLAQRTVR